MPASVAQDNLHAGASTCKARSVCAYAYRARDGTPVRSAICRTHPPSGRTLPALARPEVPPSGLAGTPGGGPGRVISSWWLWLAATAARVRTPATNSSATATTIPRPIRDIGPGAAVGVDPVGVLCRAVGTRSAYVAGIWLVGAPGVRTTERCVHRSRPNTSCSPAPCPAFIGQCWPITVTPTRSSYASPAWTHLPAAAGASTRGQCTANRQPAPGEPAAVPAGVRFVGGTYGYAAFPLCSRDSTAAGRVVWLARPTWPAR